LRAGVYMFKAAATGGSLYSSSKRNSGSFFTRFYP
jgi:hypothetical protein